MEITARVRRSYHPRQSFQQAKLARHIVLDVPLDGRLRREAGDALCRPAHEFYELERDDVDAEATCRTCVERAARYGVRVITTAAPAAETVEQDQAEQVPAVHYFDSSADAYNETQFRDDIADGDVLVIKSEAIVGFLRSAWPGAITAAYGELHTFTADPRTIDDGKYAASVDLAERLARVLGAPLAEKQPAAGAEVEVGQPVVEGVVVEHAGTAMGSTPSNATHPNVVAARLALRTLRAAEMTEHHDVSEPTVDEREVRGYLIDPREGRRVAVYWLEGGRIVRHDDDWHGLSLDIVADRLRRSGWAIEKMLRSSLCVFAHRPETPAGPQFTPGSWVVCADGRVRTVEGVVRRSGEADRVATTDGAEWIAENCLPAARPCVHRIEPRPDVSGKPVDACARKESTQGAGVFNDEGCIESYDCAVQAANEAAHLNAQEGPEAGEQPYSWDLMCREHPEQQVDTCEPCHIEEGQAEVGKQRGA